MSTLQGIEIAAWFAGVFIVSFLFASGVLNLLRRKEEPNNDNVDPRDWD